MNNCVWLSTAMGSSMTSCILDNTYKPVAESKDPFLQWKVGQVLFISSSTGNQHFTLQEFPGAAFQGAQGVVAGEGNGKNQGLLLVEVTCACGT